MDNYKNMVYYFISGVLMAHMLLSELWQSVLALLVILSIDGDIVVLWSRFNLQHDENTRRTNTSEVEVFFTSPCTISPCVEHQLILVNSDVDHYILIMVFLKVHGAGIFRCCKICLCSHPPSETE